MRASLKFLLLAVFIIQVVACADQRESAADQYLRQQVTRESGGALAVASFAKTNGIEQSLGGMEFYTLEWQARLAVEADIWKGGNAFVGYWSDFSVRRDQPGMWDNLLGGGNAREFVKGATVVLTGESQLQKTENGWRVVGSDVKTSQTLNNQRSPAALAERERQRGLRSAVTGTWSLQTIDGAPLAAESRSGVLDLQGSGNWTNKIYESVDGNAPVMIQWLTGTYTVDTAGVALFGKDRRLGSGTLIGNTLTLRVRKSDDFPIEVWVLRRR